MIEGPVREALAAAGPEATALDLACCEGWFSHRLLEWGAGATAHEPCAADRLEGAGSAVVQTKGLGYSAPP